MPVTPAPRTRNSLNEAGGRLGPSVPAGPIPRPRTAEARPRGGPDPGRAEDPSRHPGKSKFNWVYPLKFTSETFIMIVGHRTTLIARSVVLV